MQLASDLSARAGAIGWLVVAAVTVAFAPGCAGSHVPSGATVTTDAGAGAMCVGEPPACGERGAGFGCCLPAGVASCVGGAWMCDPGPRGPRVPTTECARVAMFCDGPQDAGAAPPPPPPDPPPPPPPPSLAVFIDDCGPDDGPAIRLYAAATPFECAAASSLGEHIEIVFFTAPRSDDETMYYWGPGRIALAAFYLCNGTTCETPPSGELTVGYRAGLYMLVTWRANLADGTVATGEIDASYCHGEVFCG